MRKNLLLIITLALLFVSCSSIGSLAGFEDQGLPSWVRNPRVRRGRIAYVCEGSGTSEEEARINALSSVLYEIGDDVGRDAYSLYFRELESSGEVEDLDGSIRETYTREYRGGRFSCYVLFDMSEASLLSLRTPDLLVLLEAEEDVRNLLDEARSYYMENRDVDAISSALSALSISIEHELDEPEISPEGILSTLIYYTEPLEIRVRQFDGGIDASVSVMRNRGLLSPRVRYAPLNISYLIRTPEGEIISEDMDFNTADEGSYDYVNTNPYALRSGEANLSFNLDETLIEAVKEIAGEDFLLPFTSLLEEKSISYSYDEREEDETAPYTILVAEYDENGAFRDSHVALDELNATLSSSDRLIVAERGYGDSDAQIISEFAATSSPERYIVIMRLGVSDSVSLPGGRYLVNVGTTMSIYDTEGGENSLIYSDSYTSAVGDGMSYEEARRDAFRDGGRLLANVLLMEF